MIENRDPPVLNPVLSLQMEPALESRPGGGKGRLSTVFDRLGPQQLKLSSQARSLYGSKSDFPSFGSRTLLAVRMFDDSLAPSHTPNDLFGSIHDCWLLAPLHNGYLVEVDLEQFRHISTTIQYPRNFALKSDISRVSDITAFDDEARLRGRSVFDLWQSAPEDENGRHFTIWLAPFRDREAREDLFEELNRLIINRSILPILAVSRLPTNTDETPSETLPSVSALRQSSIARAMRSYRNTGVGHATVTVPSMEHLSAIVTSGAVFRIDPIHSIQVTSPGTGAHPPPPFQLGDAPTVAVVDGGLHTQSYRTAEAWRATPFVSDNQADREHGNGVTSLVVHGYAWNNNRNLPSLDCHIGTIQLVPSKNSTVLINDHELIDYLDNIAREHPETHVWNISANKSGPGLNFDEVSILGHELSRLARRHHILPVVSIGNVGPHNKHRPNPPADCEGVMVESGVRVS